MDLVAVDDDFKTGLSLVRTFARREGHAAVPHGHVEGGFKLGYWVAVKRIQHRLGRVARQRVRALEALPGWSWRRMEDRFRKGLEHLRRFVKREGHARVPARHSEGPFRLGVWISAVRRSHHLEKLPRNWTRLLERMPGWTWNAQVALFERGLRHLRAFVRREGHARVPRSHLERQFRLGEWVASQRQQRRRGAMPEERARTLQAVRGWTWSVAQTRFEEGYGHLLRFAKRKGHARVPLRHREAGFALGRWASERRRRRSRMSARRRRRLEALPGWIWTPREAEFEERFQLLHRFATREGHARVPHSHVERGVRLGKWVANLRHKRQKLPPATRRRLAALRGWAWRVKLDTFDRAARLLRTFARREGHAAVPQRHVEAGFPLGAWVSRCRRGRVRLTAERVKTLESIPGWVWGRPGRGGAQTRPFRAAPSA